MAKAKIVAIDYVDVTKNPGDPGRIPLSVPIGMPTCGQATPEERIEYAIEHCGEHIRIEPRYEGD